MDNDENKKDGSRQITSCIDFLTGWMRKKGEKEAKKLGRSTERAETRKSTRLFYNTQQRLLIAKLMPNREHEFPIRAFSRFVDNLAVLLITSLAQWESIMML